MKKLNLAALAALGLAVLLIPQTSRALVSSPDLFGFDFRFSNPGARANAMGGAFIGLADDASAAYTNPAGLTVLTRSEVSVEYKQVRYTTVITDFAPENSEYEKGLGGMSFVSYAYPRDRATITLFRHNMINTENDFTWHDQPSQQYHSENHIKLNGITYGLGLGYKLFDNLSLGLTVNSTQMEYLSTSTGYDDDGSSTHPQNIDNISRASGSDTDEHFTLSLLWNVVDELNLGLVYRQGPKYTFTYNRMSWNTTLFEIDAPVDQEMKVPDVYGVGLSYKLPMGLTLSADATFIKYSQLFSDILWEVDTGIPNAPKTYTTNSDFYIDDEWEYHAGLEYVIELGRTPVALRAGYYLKPANYFKYRGNDPTNDFATNDWSRKDDNIYTAGLGFVLGENVQIDLAGMFGDFTTEGILSLVYRFQ